MSKRSSGAADLGQLGYNGYARIVRISPRLCLWIYAHIVEAMYKDDNEEMTRPGVGGFHEYTFSFRVRSGIDAVKEWAGGSLSAENLRFQTNQCAWMVDKLNDDVANYESSRGNPYGKIAAEFAGKMNGFAWLMKAADYASKMNKMTNTGGETDNLEGMLQHIELGIPRIDSWSVSEEKADKIAGQALRTFRVKGSSKRSSGNASGQVKSKAPWIAIGVGTAILTAAAVSHARK